MKTEKIFYRIARNYPVYYKVDPKGGIIESVKNWSQYAKAIDRFNYSAVFARELYDTYEEISAEAYDDIRQYVSQIIAKRTAARLQSKNQDDSPQ